LITDSLSELLAHLERHSASGKPRRDPARLEHNYVATHNLKKGRRNPRRLPGSGRSLNDEVRCSLQRLDDLRENRLNRQSGLGVGHASSEHDDYFLVNVRDRVRRIVAVILIGLPASLELSERTLLFPGLFSRTRRMSWESACCWESFVC
jgi:hypothetical protein